MRFARISAEYNKHNGIVKPFHNLLDALDAPPSDSLFVVHWVNEDEHEEVTFGVFRRRCRVQAAMLHEHGVTPGDRVVIIMQQGISAMTVFAGAMMLQAIPAFLAYPNFKVEPSKYRAGLAGVTANLAARIVVIDGDFPPDLLSHVSLTGGAKLVHAVSANSSAVTPGDFSSRPASDSLAFIQHSAGTTGLQKGVALTHAAVLRQLAHLSEVLHIEADSDRIYSWLPLYHDMGLIACFILPLASHIPVVIQSPLDWVMHPDTMLQVISEYKCTLAWLPNFAFQFVPRRTLLDRVRQYGLSKVRALINCSEPVRTSSMDEFRNAFATLGLNSNALHSSYAMAENVFAVTQSDPRQAGPKTLWADVARFRTEHRVYTVEAHTPDALRFTSSGKLLPNHALRIVANDGTPLSDANVGEIWVKSDCLFDGYYNRPDLTAEVLVDGWYRTGDLGFRLSDDVFVVGRKKDLLIVGGENLYPQDIEEIVSTHPAVHDGRSIALGLFNAEIGTEDIVVIAEVMAEEQLARGGEIEHEIRARIVAGLGVSVRQVLFKPPKWIVKSTAGKPARSETREKLLREHPELSPQPQENAIP